MKKYIPKDTLLAEIDDMLKTREETSHLAKEAFNSGRWKALMRIKDILNTLEVQSLWHDAQGTDLPEIDREVVVFIQKRPGGFMQTAVAHRPNPNGWDGKDIFTGKKRHHTPVTHDKGGWNVPDVKFWLDVELPNPYGEE